MPLSDTGEALLDDRLDNHTVDAVVVAIEMGEEKARCNMGTRISANMLWGAGYHRDAYVGGGLESKLIRIFVREK